MNEGIKKVVSGYYEQNVHEAIEGMRVLARVMHEYHLALLGAGFTDEQALKLVAEWQKVTLGGKAG